MVPDMCAGGLQAPVLKLCLATAKTRIKQQEKLPADRPNYIYNITRFRLRTLRCVTTHHMTLLVHCADIYICKHNEWTPHRVPIGHR